LNLDPVLESVTDSAAATTQTEYATRGFRTRQQPDEQPTGLGGLSMDVHLTIANDFVVKSNDITAPDAPIGLGAVNMTLGGDLRVQKNAGARAIRLIGTVKTVRGTYDFQGRRFTILRDGTVLFDGLDYANPTLNVIAQRTIQGVQANVNVRGNLKMPEVVLTSVPPLERSEILSLIVFNQPINNLGEGQQVALTQRAEQMAAGVLANQLTNSLGKALNLTEFDIRTGAESGAAAQITAGEQLSQNLYAKIEQGIGDVSTTNVILEYELAKWLRLRTNWLQGSSAQPLIFQRTQDSGVDLLFFFTH
jgi:autotransporter translocation and assembly factor TamB